MHHVDAGHHLEQLANHVRAAPIAGRGHVDLARTGLGVGDEFGNRVGRHRWMHQQDVGLAANAPDRCDVADKVVVKFVIERRADHRVGTDQEECITVRWCSHDDLKGDIAAGAGSVFDDKRLAKPFREQLTHEACKDVGRAAGSRGGNDAHRARWIGVCPCDAG